MRADNAREILEKIKDLPPPGTRFENLWYDFLVNFNNAFSQLEQGSKSSQKSMRWFSTVKTFRKSDALLTYLQHARNSEEHSELGSLIRTELVLKPMTKNVTVQYGDEKGVRRDKPAISAQQGSGLAKVKIKWPGVRFRTVIDRGKTYSFSQQYRHKVLDQLLETGELTLDEGQLNIVGLVRIALEHLQLIISEAEALPE